MALTFKAQFLETNLAWAPQGFFRGLRQLDAGSGISVGDLVRRVYASTTDGEIRMAILATFLTTLASRVNPLSTICHKEFDREILRLWVRSMPYVRQHLTCYQDLALRVQQALEQYVGNEKVTAITEADCSEMFETVPDDVEWRSSIADQALIAIMRLAKPLLAATLAPHYVAGYSKVDLTAYHWNASQVIVRTMGEAQQIDYWCQLFEDLDAARTRTPSSCDGCAFVVCSPGRRANV